MSAADIRLAASTVTSLCLGPVPYAEQLLDMRVLSEPINTPPVLTAEKPNWRIQRSYEFDLPGIDHAASFMRARLEMLGADSASGAARDQAL
eukprot:2867724-Rhodomonas_salina.4